MFLSFDFISRGVPRSSVSSIIIPSTRCVCSKRSETDYTNEDVRKLIDNLLLHYGLLSSVCRMNYKYDVSSYPED